MVNIYYELKILLKVQYSYKNSLFIILAISYRKPQDFWKIPNRLLHISAMDKELNYK